MATMLDTRGAHTGKAKCWTKRMSTHIAYALLVYTLLMIFFVSTAIKSHGMSLLPYFSLVLLVAVIIPACRLFERRWTDMEIGHEGDTALAPRFRREAAYLWGLAIGLPLGLAVLFRVIALFA